MDAQLMIPAHSHLREFVCSVWQVSGKPVYTKETIIPKGIVEVIFNFSGPAVINAQFGTRQLQLNKCFINGFNTVPVLLTIPSYHSFFGIRFHPFVIRQIFGVPSGEFFNQPVDLTLVDATIEELWYQLAELQNFNARVLHFTNWLNARLYNIHPGQKAMNDFLYGEQETGISVPALSRLLFVSTRQLSRTLYEHTGMNTEEILIYKKYLRSLKLMHETKLSLTEIAYSSNFFDQSHFIKTFKSFAQMTPSGYQKVKSTLKGHIYQ